MQPEASTSQPRAPNTYTQTYGFATQQTKDICARELRNILASYRTTGLRLAATTNHFAALYRRDANDSALLKECRDALTRPSVALSASPTTLQGALGGYARLQDVASTLRYGVNGMSGYLADRSATVSLTSSPSPSTHDEQNSVDGVKIKEEAVEDDEQLLALGTQISYQTPSGLLTRPMLWHPRQRMAHEQRFPVPAAQPATTMPQTQGAGPSTPDSPLVLAAERKALKRSRNSAAHEDEDDDKRPNTRARLELRHSPSPRPARHDPHRRTRKRSAAPPPPDDLPHTMADDGLRTPRVSSYEASFSEPSPAASPVVATASGPTLIPLSLSVERASLKRARNSDEDIEGDVDVEDRRPSTRVKVESVSDTEAFGSLSAGARRTQGVVGEKMAADRASARAFSRRKEATKKITTRLRRDSFGDIPGVDRSQKCAVNAPVNTRRSTRLLQKPRMNYKGKA